MKQLIKLYITILVDILGTMNKLIPFNKFTKRNKGNSPLDSASIAVDEQNIPIGFFFGRDAFISLMTVIDEQFEQTAKTSKDAYNNFAGKAIDLIEETLPVSAEFAKTLEKSIADAQKKGWISFDEVAESINA